MTDNERETRKKTEVMDFLHRNVFDPILTSPNASSRLTQGVRLTITRMNERDAAGIVHYYWSAVIGTEKSTAFARQMRAEGFARFEDEEVLVEFRERFNDGWIRG
jgi:hypothetical protein